MSERFSVNGKANPLHNPRSAEFKARSTALRSKTDQRLDHLTELWREMEKKLVGLQQPRHVYCVCCHDEDYYCCIGIARYAGKWRLCIGYYNEHERECDNPISWRPVTDCTVEERVQVAMHLNRLEQTILETGEEFLPKIDEAIRLLENRLADI